ncbi:hypothetical protein L1887_61125 [Cichorium endivia]|nr:hypothetical protein L1887_61125 [Cichorium endivia]
MNDHLKCRLVNKKCQFVIDNNIKINELAIRNSKDCRFTKLFYDLNYHSIEHGVFLWTSNVYLFNTKHLTERLKNLRRLFIDLPCANQARKMFSFLTGYNQLTKLEQLEFRSINLNRPESLHLPNLRMLAVQYSYGNLLTLNMPSLNSFATNDSLAKFEFEFPLVLTHLSVELFEEAILRFTNLTHLRIQMFEYDSGLIFRIIPTDLPRVLLQLRELHCRNWVRRDVVYNMIANKILAKQNDFVFFHFGVRLDTLDDLADATPDGEVAYLRDGDLAANFSWILSHFAKLDAVLPWIHKIDYNGLASGGHIDADFFRRFLNVQKIIVDTRVEDAAAFTQFLRHFRVQNAEDPQAIAQRRGWRDLHGRRGDLFRIESGPDRVRSQAQTNIGANFVYRRTETGQHTQTVGVHFARVRLAANDVRTAEAGQLRDQLIQLFDFCFIVVEDLQERCLRTGGALAAAESQIIARSLQIAQIHHQVVQPECGTLSDGDQLCRLHMREAQSGHRLVQIGELGQSVDAACQFWQENIETVTQTDQIGVVADKATCLGGAKVKMQIAVRCGLGGELHSVKFEADKVVQP